MENFIYGFILGCLPGPFLFEGLKFGYLRLKTKLRTK